VNFGAAVTAQCEARLFVEEAVTKVESWEDLIQETASTKAVEGLAARMI
jgi:hypothetical protein